MDKEVIVFVGIFLGVLARTALPVLRKIHSGDVEKFELKYLFSALAGILLSLVAAALMFNEFNIQPGEVALFSAFTYGFTFNSIVNEAMHYAQTKKPKKEEPDAGT